MASNLTIKKGPKSLQQIAEAIRLAGGVEVLVGFPAETSERETDPKDEPINNAALAYIHDNGMPEQNIPARPFMRPAIESMEGEVTRRLRSMAASAASGDADSMAQKATALGLRAKLAVQNKINEGLDPALAESTLRARARRGRAGAKEELDNRAKGQAPSTQLAKPLIDTGQLRNAVNYVIRKKERS